MLLDEKETTTEMQSQNIFLKKKKKRGSIQLYNSHNEAKNSR